MSTWPITLPQALLVEDFSTSEPNVKERTSMDAGPPKQRRKNTAGARPVQGKLKLTSTQLSTFRTFYNTTLLNGSLIFDWVDPLDNVTVVDMRFVEVPVYTREGPHFIVELSLEIMP